MGIFIGIEQRVDDVVAGIGAGLNVVGKVAGYNAVCICASDVISIGAADIVICGGVGDSIVSWWHRSKCRCW